MIKSQFPYHLLSYVRSEWNKLSQDTTEDMQFFQPPCLLQPPAYLLSDLFPTPHLLPPPSIPDWRVCKRVAGSPDHVLEMTSKGIMIVVSNIIQLIKVNKK